MRCLWQGVKAMFRGLALTFFVFVFAVVSFPNLGFSCAVVSFILFARLVLVSAVSRLRWFRVGV